MITTSAEPRMTRDPTRAPIYGVCCAPPSDVHLQLAPRAGDAARAAHPVALCPRVGPRLLGAPPGGRHRAPGRTPDPEPGRAHRSDRDAAAAAPRHSLWLGPPRPCEPDPLPSRRVHADRDDDHRG